MHRFADAVDVLLLGRISFFTFFELHASYLAEEDLIAIFEPLPLQPEGQGNDDDALAQMLSGLGLEATR